MSSQTKKSFVGGAALLAASGLIGKVIAAFYKVWLAGLLGSGMSFFNLVYPIYTFLLIISSAGLPTAISRMVSRRLSADDRIGAREVMRVARRMLFGTGIGASLLMFVLAKPLAIACGDAEAAPAFAAIAPAIFCVCIISTYRGYFQGMQRMAPTAASQLIEQVGKVAIGFPLVQYGLQYGVIWGAVGAIAGVVASELAAMILMLGASARQSQLERDLPSASTGEKGILRALFIIAIPITVGSAIMPIVGMLDSFQVINRLQEIGYTLEKARLHFSAQTTIVGPMINMPAVITLALSTALVPAISAASISRDKGAVLRNVQTGIKLATLVGLPAAVGMGMLSDSIVRFVFASQVEEVKYLGAQLLTIMAGGIFCLSLIQTTTGIMQGLGKPLVPVYTMGAGVIVKLILNHVLLGDPNIGIRGASIATFSCYVVAAIGNMYFVLKYSKCSPKFLLFLIRPMIAAGGMAGVLAILQRTLMDSMSHARFTLVAIALGGIVYVVLALLCKALTPEDMEMIPGGNKLMRLAGKFKKGSHRK